MLGSIIAFFLVFILSVLYYEFYRYDDPAEEIKGTILISAPVDEEKSGIYKIPLSENEERRQFFSVYSDRYNYPFVQDGNFFCVGYLKKLDQSVLYMVKGAKPSRETSEIIARVQGNMIFPAVTKDLNTIYFIKENNEHKDKYKYNLYQYDRKEQKESVLSEDTVDTSSKILLLKDGSLIYTRDDKCTIMQVYPDGRSKILIETGMCPVWLDKDQRFLYCEYDSKAPNPRPRIMLYHLDTEEKSFVNYGMWNFSPTISPDKKHMIFSENHTFYLSTIEGKRIKIIRQLGGYDNQPFWLE